MRVAEGHTSFGIISNLRLEDYIAFNLEKKETKNCQGSEKG